MDTWAKTETHSPTQSYCMHTLRTPYAYPPHTCRVSASCAEGDLPTYGPVLKEMLQSFTAPPLPKY